MRRRTGVVKNLRQTQAEFRRRPIDHRRTHRQRLHIHLLPAHRLQTQTHVIERRGDDANAAQEVQRKTIGRALDHCAVAIALGFHEIDPLWRKPVRMRIHHRRRPCAARRLDHFLPGRLFGSSFPDDRFHRGRRGVKTMRIGARRWITVCMGCSIVKYRGKIVCG